MSIVYRSAAIAHATSSELVRDQTVVVEGRTIAYLGPDEDSGALPGEARIVDAGGATIVPGLVDAHSHTVMPGGSHWIDRMYDTEDELLRVAEENGDLAFRAGVRWLRDVGSPQGGRRAIALDVRDAWAERHDRPYVRAAGTWIATPDYFEGFVEAHDADALADAVEQQIEDGADLIKLYLDGPDPATSPFSASDVAGAVGAARAHEVPVTAHATTLAGAQAGVLGGVDCIEHGIQLDEHIVAAMVEKGTHLVPTLAIHLSWASFGATTTLDRFTSDAGRERLAARREDAAHSFRIAIDAGVAIAAGTDFGGGSLRANQLPWEIEAMVTGGLEPWRALAAATWVGGDLLGEPGAGRLREGGPADFFLVHGDPLSDPGALWRVWKHG
jgi:imidazolonepropionase-like amidohydrolase